MLRFILKPDRDKSIRQRHPWVFSGAVARRSGPVHPGETVDIISSEGVWLARGTASTHSQMIARLWTWQRDEELDPVLFANGSSEPSKAANNSTTTHKPMPIA